MRAVWIFAVLFQAGCANLPEIESLSDQNLPDDAIRLEALPQTVSAEGDDKSASPGFFDRLFGDSAKKPSDAPADFELAGDGSEKNEQVAATASQEDTSGTEASAATKVASLDLYSNTATASQQSSAALVDLAYGTVVKNCAINPQKMGRKVASFPEKRAKYVVYDSNPGSDQSRPHFVVGFDDGCARQFSASLAIFGTVGMHESLRYGLPAEVQPYSETDRAYERLKTRVCKVPRRKPCGGRLRRLEKNTVFLSIYNALGDNSSWTNMLLHDGKVMATAKVLP